jgi:hypothetical protein
MIETADAFAEADPGTTATVAELGENEAGPPAAGPLVAEVAAGDPKRDMLCGDGSDGRVVLALNWACEAKLIDTHSVMVVASDRQSRGRWGIGVTVSYKAVHMLTKIGPRACMAQP